jgi:hypothetical protein
MEKDGSGYGWWHENTESGEREEIVTIHPDFFFKSSPFHDVQAISIFSFLTNYIYHLFPLKHTVRWYHTLVSRDLSTLTINLSVPKS